MEDHHEEFDYDSEEEEYDNENNEEDLITFYFQRGFPYREICLFLEKRHHLKMSISTLKRRIKSYGLGRHNTDFDLDAVKKAIQDLVDGAGCLHGYRGIWHCLQLKGILVPRIVVQLLLREIDPEGTEMRKAHRLKRRTYTNPGPSYSWHCDGYDKLKPFGFPIHGCIDGWSRKIIWLYVTRSNNNPNNVATYYLDAVQEFGGCPLHLITDMGTENGTMAATHCYFRDDINCHRYVPSPRNQRIECWWSFFRKTFSTWWINFFKDVIEQGKLDTTSTTQMECIWFCFAELLQESLNEVKEQWNTHYIRGSRHETIKGRPDSLYFLPELHGALGTYILPVPKEEMTYARSEIVECGNEEVVCQEYFRYVMNECNLSQPKSWRDALGLYSLLLYYSENDTE